MPGDYERMDTLFRSRPEFNDYVAQKIRAHKLREYERRIDALRRAQQTLKAQPVYRLSGTDVKSASSLCARFGWSEEDAASFVEDFQAKCPRTSQTPAADRTRVASGVSSIAQALMHA